MEKNDTTKIVVEKYVEAETVSEDSENSSLSNFTDAVSEIFSSDISTSEILIVEPFNGGSHKQLIEILDIHLNSSFTVKKTSVFSLPGKKWPWRARTSALYFSRIIPKNNNYKVLFCSSVLNLTELIALRLDLSVLFKVIYFHENQLVYPVQKHTERDFQYGYNQILSAMVADVVIFNSYYNMNSFLCNIDSFLKLQPDFRVKNIAEELSPKCSVVYFPVEVPHIENNRGDILHIIWPHRWEHDKNPQLFFETLFKLKNNNFHFNVSILGESFEKIPEIFHEAKEILKNEIIQFGRISSRDDYFRLLRSGHVVVSTASHEFFGVAMLEAVMSGCFPLAWNNLVYPEIYPVGCLYNTPNQLYKKLKVLCEKPYLAQVFWRKAEINFDNFSVEVNPFLEGISKVKDLIQELEESFRESSTVGNNLILRCVLLRAENQNLVYKIDEKNRNLSTTVHKKQLQLSVLSQGKSKSTENSANRITCTSQCKTSLHHPLLLGKAEEIDILHKTIGDFQKKLKEKEKKIETLCQKYLYLKTNKNKMENDLKGKIQTLEKQLEVTHKALLEFQVEVETLTGRNLSQTKNTYEALFLQEKLRCSKLMYEKVRLNHEIKRLEDVIRKQNLALEDENNYRKFFKSVVDKSTSEPFVRHLKAP